MADTSQGADPDLDAFWGEVNPDRGVAVTQAAPPAPTLESNWAAIRQPEVMDAFEAAELERGGPGAFISPSGRVIPDANRRADAILGAENERQGQPRHRSGPIQSVQGRNQDITATPFLRAGAEVVGLPNTLAWLGEKGTELAGRAVGMDAPERGWLPRLFRGAQSITPSAQEARDAFFDHFRVRETNADSVPGRIVQGVTEFGAGSAIPTQAIGWLPRLRTNALLGGLSGLFSSSAGEATAGTSAEPWARAIGALGVPLLAAGAMSLRPSVAQLLYNQVRGTPNATLKEAERLLRESHAAGNPMLATEALQRAMGQPSTVIQGVQREVGTSLGGAKQMDEFMHNRAGANRTTFEDGLSVLEGRAPPGRTPPPEAGNPAFPLTDTLPPASTPNPIPLPPPNPAMAGSIPSRVATTARDRIGEVRTARNAAARPYFAQAVEQLHAGTPEAITGLLETRRAIEDTGHELTRMATTTQDPALNALLRQHNIGELLEKFSDAMARQGVGGNHPPGAGAVLPLFEDLNNARATFVDALNKPVQPHGVSLPSDLAQRVESVLDDMLARISTASDHAAGGAGRGGFGQGMNIYRAASDSAVNPLVDGAVGKLAATESAQVQARTLFAPSPRGAPLPQTPEATRAAVLALADQPQGALAARDLIANMLRESFESVAARKAHRVENPHSGAEFAADVAGNAEQRAALEAGVRALPHGEEAWKGLQRMFDLFEAHQFTPNINAVSDARSQVGRSLRTNSGMMAPQGGTVATRIFDKIVGLIDDSHRKSNTELLARLLTSADGITRLRALARANGLRPRENAVLNGIWNAYRATDDADVEPRRQQARGGRVGYEDGGQIGGRYAPVIGLDDYTRAFALDGGGSTSRSGGARVTGGGGSVRGSVADDTGARYGAALSGSGVIGGGERSLRPEALTLFHQRPDGDTYSLDLFDRPQYGGSPRPNDRGVMLRYQTRFARGGLV